MIRYIISQIIKVEGILFIVPVITALVYGEWQGLVYLLCGIGCVIFGMILSIRKPKSNLFYLREGCVATALCWIILSIIGALPLVLTNEIPSFIDALFEIVSGFTTTGSSILPDVEALSHTSLMWRSFTHWVGGMGILVFLLAVIPLTGGSNVNLMKAESPGPQVDKTLPQVRTTALLLYVIYTVMTLIEFVALIIAKMPVFDAICMSFGSAGTGGFGILGDSCASYPVAAQVIITISMLLFGVNFNIYIMIIFKRFKNIWRNDEIKTYFIIVIIAIAIITFNIYDLCNGFGDALNKASFQVASVITTTGFATCDFNVWPTLSKCVLVMMMFTGACAGSTAGGLKIQRICILFKCFIKEANSFLHPREIKKIKTDGQTIDNKVIRATNVYLVTYLFIFVCSVLIISIEGNDFTTTFTAVAATFNNIGPGLELVGPNGNFAFFSDLSKIVLIFDMLAGRLEIFPLLMLFHPGIWHDAFTKYKKTY